MDLTNRAIIITGALIWIFVALLVILLVWTAPDRSIERLADLANYLDKHNTTGGQLVVTFGALIFALLGVMLIIFELSPPGAGAVRVTNVGSGEVSIATDEIARRLEEDLRGVPQLGDVKAAVISRGTKAEVKLDLFVSSDSDLPGIVDAALRRARELVEGRMGIALAGPPQARIHYREVRVSSVRQVRPDDAGAPYTPPPSAPPVPSSTSVSSASESSTHGTATESTPEDRRAGA